MLPAAGKSWPIPPGRNDKVGLLLRKLHHYRGGRQLVGSGAPEQCVCYHCVRHHLARPGCSRLSDDGCPVQPAALGGFTRLDDVVPRLGFDLAARRAPGTFPIRASPAMTSSQARIAACSKSSASAGRTCQPVTFFPKTRIERMLGKSRRRLWWCSSVVASHTPLSAARSCLSRRMRTIFSLT